MLHAVIMSGGSGTRFWPQSRTAIPKQLLNLTGDATMIQQTVARCDSLIELDNFWVVTNAVQVEATRKQLNQLNADHILVEPAARNTAPCIALAAAHLLKVDSDAIMLVMPSDHVIRTYEDFQNGVQSALELVNNNPQLLTLFGVTPTFASTGFGYIERSTELDLSQGKAFQVKSFREKPEIQVAEEYIKSGTFFWNCGIFLWRADAILDALKKFEPETIERIETIADSIGTSRYEEVLEKEFPQCRSESIDYAVLEKADDIAVVEAPFQWDDLGSWQALQRLHGEDENGNTIIGLHLGVETEGCIVRSTPKHLIATIGMKNCIVVHTPDATLVADKDDENAIKELIALLKKQEMVAYL